MVSHKEPERKRGGTARILAAIAIIAVGLFLLASVMPGAQAQAGAQPATTISNYTPTPTMNTNVTWSSFENGWSPLEYSNGTANLSLNADMSSTYANPISLNPTDIIAPGALQNEKVGSNYWNDSNYWGWAGGPTGTNQTRSVTNSTTNGITEIQLTDTITGNLTQDPYTVLTIPSNTYPSQNPAYDYVTVSGEYTAPQNSHTSINILLANQTGAYTTMLHTPAPADTPIMTQHNLANMNTKFNTTAGSGYSDQLSIQIILYVPNPTTTGTYTITISALTMTSYPLTLGTNSTGATIQNGTGTIHLANLSPSFPYKEITDNGYSVAVSQPMQNLTEQQTSINDGTYTEQATYQGIFSLPSAPDLSYSASNITVPLTLPSTQYEVANLNGASFLSSIQSQPNGTFTFGTVNPNSQNSLVLEVKYTSAQWDASSSPPSFFSLAGLEYYWWVSVVGFLSLIGLAALATHDFGGDEGNLRAPKGKLGR